MRVRFGRLLRCLKASDRAPAAVSPKLHRLSSFFLQRTSLVEAFRLRGQGGLLNCGGVC